MASENMEELPAMHDDMQYLDNASGNNNKVSNETSLLMDDEEIFDLMQDFEGGDIPHGLYHHP